MHVRVLSEKDYNQNMLCRQKSIKNNKPKFKFYQVYEYHKLSHYTTRAY